MSMQHYAVNDYGLYLDFETLKYMASKFCKDFTPEAFADDEWSYLEELYEKGLVERMSEFTGEAMIINDDGTPEWGVTHATYGYDECWYAGTYKQPRMFGAAYKDMDELIEEFRDRIGEYLPEDYDYRSNLCLICGTYFG